MTCPKTIKGCALVGTKTSNNNNNNRNFECLYFMSANHHVLCGLQCSAHHLGGRNCPKFMHKFKYIEIIDGLNIFKQAL